MDRLPEVPLIVPADGGVITDFLRRWYGSDFSPSPGSLVPDRGRGAAGTARGPGVAAGARARRT